jgi:sodium/proline symporter
MINQGVLITIIVYNFLLIAIGFWAKKRTSNQDDFYLGGRGLGPFVAALSASASSSSAWSLLGVSGAAYVWGLSAIWLLPGVLIGYFVSWTWVAPRLMEISQQTGAVTLPELLFGGFDEKEKIILLRLTTIIITCSLIVYVAAQFQGAGTAFSNVLGISQELSIIIGATVILIYTFIGGFWAASLTDTIQAILMFIVALFLPLFLLIFIGGFDDLIFSVKAIGTEAEGSLTGVHTGLMGLGFIIGTISIGFGYPGQPFVVNRFMAARDIKAIRRGRIIAIGWATIIFGGMILLGLCAKVMYSTVPDPESVLFFISQRLFGPVFAGIITAAVLSAIMSTADSQLLAVASSVDRDWKGGKGTNISSARVAIFLVVIFAIILSLYAPETIFTRVVFAWTALGAAFVPMVFSKVLSWRVSSIAAGLSIVTGFLMTVILHQLPDTPGDILERVLPMLLGFIILSCSRRSLF